MKEHIICDIDGTISKVGNRLRHLKKTPKDWDSFYAECGNDSPIFEIISLISAMAKMGYKITFLTGRRESCRGDTEEWLLNWLPAWMIYYDLLMRPNKDHRHDTLIKPEIAMENQLSPENVLFILEDRNTMVKKWRELGFKCLQVRDGNF